MFGRECQVLLSTPFTDIYHYHENTKQLNNEAK